MNWKINNKILNIFDYEECEPPQFILKQESLEPTERRDLQNEIEKTLNIPVDRQILISKSENILEDSELLMSELKYQNSETIELSVKPLFITVRSVYNQDLSLSIEPSTTVQELMKATYLHSQIPQKNFYLQVGATYLSEYGRKIAEYGVKEGDVVH